MAATAQQILALIPGATSRGDLALASAVWVATPRDARPGCLSWLRPGTRAGAWQGSVLLTADDPPSTVPPFQAWISCPNPRLAYARVVRKLFPELLKPPVKTISETAFWHDTAVIGAEGQGLERDGDELVKIPQLGGVTIGDDVEIGPCSTIMRGAITDTVIGDGTKIGNGVNIGHGVTIGRNCIITAHATIGGSCVIGDNVNIWMGALIAHGIVVGNGATISMGAVVIRDVPHNTTVVGNPARPL